MPRTESSETRAKPFKASSYRFMGVTMHPCHANYHIPGVCSHPGSKPDLAKRTTRRRARDKVARRSRRINRK